MTWGLEMMLTDPVKELAEIRSKGTPDGIVLLSADNMEEWRFLISVLGEETVYRVSRVIVRSCV
jgi:ubiquitin-conjugating enzyme E2 W